MSERKRWPKGAKAARDGTAESAEGIVECVEAIEGFIEEAEKGVRRNPDLALAALRDALVHIAYIKASAYRIQFLMEQAKHGLE